MNHGKMLSCTLAALTFTSCAVDPTDPSQDEEVDLRSIEQPLELFDNSSSYLIQRVNGPILFCLSGTGVTSDNRTGIEAAIRRYTLSWIDAVRPTATVTLTSTINFGCNSPHASFNLAATTGRPITYPDQMLVQLYSNTINAGYFHEIGHLFGLVDTYVEGAMPTRCKPGQPDGAMCNASRIWDTPAADDINAIQEVYCKAFPGQCRRRQLTSNMSNWCVQSTDELLIGDFNRDGRDDMLCHNKGSGWKSTALANSSGLFTGTSWTSDMRWCAQSTDQLLIGDFNNDGRDDMLCHNKASGWKSISLANSSGQFTGTSWTSDMRWCSQSTDELLVGDFNNDGRDDMLCHNKASGWKSISLANSSGQFTGTSWTSDMKWCLQSTDQLLIGDFNGDGRDDMLCHSKATGWKSTSLATTSSTFSGTSWTSDMKWCFGANERLHIGDFNGDGRDDMLCQNANNGRKLIAMADANVPGTFPGTSRAWAMQWCSSAGSPVQLFVGDFNNDNTSDFLCYSSLIGPTGTALQYP